MESACDEDYSLRSFGPTGQSKVKEEKAYERLHNLSSKKLEYIYELKRLVDKEQTLMELK